MQSERFEVVAGGCTCGIGTAPPGRSAKSVDAASPGCDPARMDELDPWAPADPLGRALHMLRMNGAFYCRSEASAP